MDDLAQAFLDTISTHDHFSRNTMDVEQHAEWLALCFHLDGIRPPKAGDIRKLIACLVEDVAIPNGSPPLLQTRFAPGVNYDERVHPGGRITLLPVGTAVMIFDRYVFSVGALAHMPPTPENRRAGYWIDPGWTFVATFFDRFYACIAEIMLKGDREERQRNGYSALEAMRLAGLRPGIDAEALLAERVRRVRTLRAEIEEAMRKHAYTEAVAFQEALFSRLLSDALEIHGRHVPDRLAEMVTAADKLSHECQLGDSMGLWARVHRWRKARNLIIHAPRESIFTTPEPIEAGRFRAKRAAQDGAELVTEVEVWSIEARARSLDMSLPRSVRTVPAH